MCTTWQNIYFHNKGANRKLESVYSKCSKRQDKTRQDKTRQDKTRQDKTRQDKTRQENVNS